MIFKPFKHYCFVMLALFVIATMPNNALADTCADKKIVFVGDSLFAGYGLAPGEGYPEQMAERLKQDGVIPQVVNAGVSGDTSSGGLSRLDWSLGENTHAVVLELGANDALRGIPVEKTSQNLSTMIASLQSKDVKVLLMGMRAPPNMGEVYGKKFDAIFPTLASEHDVMIYPFYLDGVAGEPELNLPDGIHPTKEGIALIVDKSYATMEKFLASVCQ